MPAGLGKNTPVSLNLGRESYEALIQRHGQWIRWRKAIKCPCTLKETQQPDLHCKRCKGSGIFYTHQKELIVTLTLCIADDTGIIELSEEYRDAVLDVIYDYNGRKYTASKEGIFIIVDTPPIKGTYVYAVLIQDTARKINKAKCVNTGDGYYRVEGLHSSRTGIDGLYHTAPGDIVKIEKVVDAAGNEWEVSELRTDLFTLKLNEEDTPELVEPLTAYGVEYVPPFVFALLNQNLSKPDEKQLVDSQGDAICTFPYNCDVGELDILTVLAGSYTKKEVINRVKGAEHDIIGAYFVLDITTCIGKDREYKKGIDYILVGTNRIKWLCEDAPAPKEAYSITYQECPTYRVIKAIPQVRTSESQRLPKKAIVQLYSAYNEKRGVNQQ